MAKLLATLITLIVIGIGVLLSQTTTWVFQAEAHEVEWLEVQGYLTAYSAKDSCHTGASCLMANGQKAFVGGLACPRVYPLGTLVRIAGGELECTDRLAKWAEYKDGLPVFDIFLGYGEEAYQEALNFGRVQTEVYIQK